MRPDFHHASPFRVHHVFRRTPLLSFPKNSPPSISLRASTPETNSTFANSISSTGRYHRTDTFRPRRFSRPRRFAPHGALQVYCTLLPIWGPTGFGPPTRTSTDQSKSVRWNPAIRTEVLLVEHPRHVFPDDRPKTTHQLPPGFEVTSPSSFPRLHHPSEFSPRTRPFQSHHRPPCFHEVRCHHLAYPSRRSSMRPSFRIHPDRCQSRVLLLSESPQPTSGV